MWQRIIQFWRAINAKIKFEDKVFIQKHLNEQEQDLFFAMRIYDQRHVLNVAYTAQKIIKTEHILDIDKTLLIKACLLHDIGRKAQDVCLFDKVINVLLAKFLPQKSKQWSEKAQILQSVFPRSFWQRRRFAMFVYYNHAQLGAKKLETIGLVEIANIIKYHHSPFNDNMKKELQILCRADSLN